MKPLPKVTFLAPGQDLNMSITIAGNISSDYDIVPSLAHSSKGLEEDLTKYLVYELSKEDDMVEEEGSRWKIDLTLPYPYSQASGNLTLSVGDGDSGNVSTTRLIIVQEGKEVVPFFDPVPKSVKTYLGKDVLINALAKGSIPIKVSSNYH